MSGRSLNMLLSPLDLFRYCPLCLEAPETTLLQSTSPSPSGISLDVSTGHLSWSQESSINNYSEAQKNYKPTKVARLGYQPKTLLITKAICSSEVQHRTVSWKTRLENSFFWPFVMNIPSIYLSINSQAPFFEYPTFWGSRWFWNHSSFSPITTNTKIV